MTQNIFALIIDKEDYKIQRVKVDSTLQQQLTAELSEQEENFIKNIENEVHFDGGWKPDENDILYLDEFPIITEMKKAIVDNTASYESLNLNKYNQLPIKAIFSGYLKDGNIVLQIQRFISSQILSRKIILKWEEQQNTFRQLSEPTFSFDNKITALFKDNKLYFKSWVNIRNMFQIGILFAEATNQDVSDILQHPKISCGDDERFKSILNSRHRRDLYLLNQNNILDKLDLNEVHAAAKDLIDIPVIDNNQIILPYNKSELNIVLDLLQDNIYKAPISKERYRTNSKIRL